ncbi:Sigma factor-binding protein Crl [Vibrio stylophorae]|uniref:Sigma factor-binding protein Crl n=1 Tax=Vibrio stylophorae TaxID=659351 RepID=A0ABN8DTJ9_9VIBR|nr:sigma factor-binding protein Crl [Vibrio stylophorae]CAH0534047.1 Sigma factor-binding protein Crl [Vibrio stylophorae]
MPNTTTPSAQPLSYGRTITKFNAIGPYLREQKSSESSYFFDCLSFCLNAKKAPEAREFWGWWLYLTPSEQGFEYQVHYGKYDERGEWLDTEIPAKRKSDVDQSLHDFLDKLSAVVEDQWQLQLRASAALSSVS